MRQLRRWSSPGRDGHLSTAWVNEGVAIWQLRSSNWGTPLSEALDVIRPTLERAANDPVAAARAEVEWPAALRRLQAAGIYVEVKVERRTVA